MALGGADLAAGDDGLAPDRARQILRDSLNAFDRAVSESAGDPDRSTALIRQAAGGFETLSDHGYRNASIEYNLGNAYYRLGDIGMAILHFRRAAAFEPSDRAIVSNLEYARDRVQPRLQAGEGSQLWRRLLFLHHAVPIGTRLWIAGAASIVGWLGLAVWLRVRRRSLALVALVVIWLSLAGGGSVAWQIHQDATSPAAVVVGGEFVLRLGRGEGYDPAISEPLGAGSEVRIIQQRGDWYEARLLNDKTGWLPGHALQRV
jgi:tetratricopeptide (TPR) repeat protein